MSDIIEAVTAVSGRKFALHFETTCEGTEAQIYSVHPDGEKFSLRGFGSRSYRTAASARLHAVRYLVQYAGPLA